MGVGLAISVDKMEKYRLGPNMTGGISKYSNYSIHNDKWETISVCMQFFSSLLYTLSFATMLFPFLLIVLMKVQNDTYSHGEMVKNRDSKYFK